MTANSERPWDRAHLGTPWTHLDPPWSLGPVAVLSIIVSWSDLDIGPDR